MDIQNLKAGDLVRLNKETINRYSSLIGVGVPEGWYKVLEVYGDPPQSFDLNIGKYGDREPFGMMVDSIEEIKRPGEVIEFPKDWTKRRPR